MQRIEGRIIVTFDTTAEPERQLEVEQYLNNVVNNLTWANLGVQIRVHLEPYSGLTAEQVLYITQEEQRDRL